MGVNTDIAAKPFQPPPPAPGTAPSGIVGHQNIRGMANKAKQQVSDRQKRFLAMMRNNATIPHTSAPSNEQYVKMGAALEEHRDTIDRFVNWVLFDL